MIYVTGDTHGAIDIHKLSTRVWKNQKNLTRDDFLIITGDFGFPFSPNDMDEDGKPVRGEYMYWLNWLKQKPYTILFVDGNHENHAFWDAQPVREWHGGRVHVHPQADNIIHLMRGEIYEIEGRTFFTFGGAASRDVAPQYDEDGKCIWKGRQEGVSYWKRENASFEEMTRALKNIEALQERGGSIDVIVTHTPPSSVVSSVLQHDRIDPTADFLEDKILKRCEFGIWLCGHLHHDLIDAEHKIIILYDTIATLDELEYTAAIWHDSYVSEKEAIIT